jgi:hypothetical protein
MGTVRWGQNKDLTDLPFCEGCFEEFTDAGTAQENAFLCLLRRVSKFVQY